MTDWNTPPTDEEKKRAGWDTPPTPEELAAAQPRERDNGPVDAAVRAAGRVGWALPGVFGLDNARADALYEWLKARVTGGPTVDVEKHTQGQRVQNERAERQHPWATLGATVPAKAVTTALGSAPLMAASGVLAAGPAAAAAGEALIESLLSLGETQGYSPEERAKRSALAGLTSAPGGSMGPLVLRNSARRAASQELAAAQRAAGGPVLADAVEETPESILEAITSKFTPPEAPDLAAAPTGAGRAAGRPSPIPQGPAVPPPSAPDAGLPPPPRPPPAASEVPPEAPNMFRRVLERQLFGEPEQPTREALMLEGRGVPLTIGQRTPKGPGNQIEEAATSLPFAGPKIKAQRDAAVDGWQNLVINAARAPGTKRVPPSGDRWEDLTRVYEGYNKAYGAIRNQEVLPLVMDGEFGVPLQTLGENQGAVARAVGSVDGIPPAVQELVTKTVERQLSRLPQRGAGDGSIAKVTAGDLMQVRRGIRDEIRKLVRAGGLEAEDRIKAYEAAEGVITSALETQLDPKNSTALRAIDAQYRNYKMVERAYLYSADSPAGFTPHQLSRGIQAATDPGEFARGGGGPLRELAQAGRVVFQQVTPPTGARQIVLSAMPKMVADPLLGGAVLKANERAVRPPWSPPDWSATVDWFR